MSPWKRKPSREALNGMTRGTLMDALGIEFLGFEGDSLKATMPVDHRTVQPFGILHGGASVALAETLGSTASHMCINPETHYSVGLAINANHVRPKREGVVSGVVKPIHVGRSTHIWEIVITDERGKLVCVSRLTTAVRERDVEDRS